MTLASGARLGPYEILSALGAGGMGEVYRARDTRLGRDVALKVLSARLGDSLDFKRRFEREARAISQISHPHICALYDVGSHEATEYLVMELLEGDTLADRLEKGALSKEQVLRFGAEIADALDAAHRRGIIHRDLKPGNVMLTKSGVKLLDFGLAKSLTPGPSPASPTEELSLQSTQQLASRPLTEKGTILGTFQYMAPEQLEGKDVDARTDIFALGCVLYETATGRKAFAGGSRASLIGAILKDNPAPISSLAPMTPPALEHVVRRCIAKEPDERWQSAADVSSELRWIAEASSEAGAPAVVASRRKNRERIGWALGIAGIAFAIAFGAPWIRRSEPPRILWASIQLPPELSIEAPNASFMFSPDGQFLVLAADEGVNAAGEAGKRQLYLRPLDSQAVRPIPGTEGATYPFWSPDGKSIGFFAPDSTLKTVDVAGGAARTICAARGVGGTWGPDGIIVFVNAGSLFKVAASGGLPLAVGPPPAKGVYYAAPHFLPDGRSVLYASLRGNGTPEKGICVLDLAANKDRSILAVASEAYWVPPDYLAYLRNGSVMLQHFDPKRSQVFGEPLTLAENVSHNIWRATAQFAFDGRHAFVYKTLTPGRPMQLAWFGSDGKKVSNLTGDPAPIIDLAVSPNGNRAAVVLGSQFAYDAQIWMFDLTNGLRTRFTLDVDRALNPAWSSDGQWLAYNCRKAGKSSIQIKNTLDGSPARTVWEGVQNLLVTKFSPDGRELLLAGQETGDGWDVVILPLMGDRTPRPLLASKANEVQAQLSPDGHWLAYWTDESGGFELDLTQYPELRGKWQVSSKGTPATIGTQGFWWNGKSEIIYLSPDWRPLVVDLKLDGDTPEISAPRLAAKTQPLPAGSVDFSPARKQFLAPVALGDWRVPPITVVTNWAAALEKK